MRVSIPLLPPRLIALLPIAARVAPRASATAAALALAGATAGCST